MQRIDGRLVYSASDLNDFLACRHLTELARSVALDEIPPPPDDESGAIVRRKGDEHEARYLAKLKASGAAVHEFPSRLLDRSIAGLEAAQEATRLAMAEGIEYIYQPTFFDGTFLGRADFLRRVPDQRTRAGFGYEVIDTKLARSAKAYFLVQLCGYSMHVAALQDGVVPLHTSVALGSGEEHTFRVDDYLAYYAYLRERFLEHVATLSAYPASCDRCKLCVWSSRCEGERRKDDHLSLVAWMRNDQIAKLQSSGIATVAQLAAATPQERPYGLNPQTFANLSQQARLQVKQRDAIAAGATGTDRFFWELLPFDRARGFGVLPEPDEGDVYFDMEGDPYYAPDTGLEYLFGMYLPKEDRYVGYWALSLAEEKRAVTEFLRFVLERRRRYPNMHVYHYASYEKTAVGRLTTRYKALDDEFDQLLRDAVFVDLFTVVRQGLRISQESYSIKKLEPFYAFERTADLRRGDDSILLFEQWLDERDDTILEGIRHYNDEDCRSTYFLHRWLLERRKDLQVSSGEILPWFAPEKAPQDERRAKENAEARELRERVLAGVTAPLDAAELAKLGERERIAWYVGNLADYHRSEAKPSWWEYFHRCSNADQLAEFDRTCIGDLRWDASVEAYKEKRSWVYTFTYPEQQHGIEAGDEVDDADTKARAGTVVGIDDERLTLQLKLSSTADHRTLRALVPKPFDGGPQRKALADLAKLYLDGTLAERHPAIVDLIDASIPRLTDRPGGARLQPADVTGEALAATIRALDASYLVVQGPPGSGKSTTGGLAIALLVESGLRVGILARSHKAAHNLVAAAEKAARTRGIRLVGAHKYSDDDDRYRSPLGDASAIANCDKAPAALSPQHRLVSGTPWLFAIDDAESAFDVLVIDEAGQLALADAIACARSAKSVVLLGDPLQLAQVSQGKHPPGIGRSILQHLLAGAATVPPERGIFLPQSWRMHPSICEFISKAVYEGRLSATPGNERNAVASPGMRGSGLRWRPVVHNGNRRDSEEEAAAIVAEIAQLLRGTFTSRDVPKPAPLQQHHILVVSPYNAQRVLLKQRLREAGFDEVAVGTVDKFQGQEAPVVFYSMATSSGEDLPREMEFLFEKNRFNVAISRAQCLSALFCSPRLLEIPCRTPEQMAMVNLLCAYAREATAQEALVSH